MGAEARHRAIADTQRQAMIERMMGDPVAFDTYATGCLKCGTPKAGHKPVYCFGDQPLMTDLKCRVKGEHLHMECQICGFLWLERCKDWDPAAHSSVIEAP